MSLCQLWKGKLAAFQPQEFLPAGSVALQAEGWAPHSNPAAVFPCDRETHCDPESILLWETRPAKNRDGLCGTTAENDCLLSLFI